MNGVSLAELVVEVLHNRGSAAGPCWSVGSGYVVRQGLVLTSAHNVGPGELLVRWHGVHELVATIRLCGEEDVLDLALLEVPHLAVQVPRPSYGVVDRNRATVVEHCWAVGFPRFKERPGQSKPFRLSVQVDGEIPTGENLGVELLTLRVTTTPRPLPQIIAESEWAGMSGAVVFAGEVLVGVVTEHHLPEGDSALSVVPITAIQQCRDSSSWWQMLGADPSQLQRLPKPSANLAAKRDAVPELEGVQAMFHLLAELSSLLMSFSPKSSWTPERWKRESTKLRALLLVLEGHLSKLPDEARSRTGGTLLALRLHTACAEIEGPSQNIRTSLNYLQNHTSSRDERARELNVFLRSSRSLQQAIRRLRGVLATPVLPFDPDQGRTSL